MKKRPNDRPKVNMRLMVPADIHRRLRVAAAKASTTGPKVLIELMDKHLPKVR